MKKQWLHLAAALFFVGCIVGCKGGDEEGPVSPAPIAPGERAAEAPTGMAGGSADVAEGAPAEGTEPTAVGDADNLEGTASQPETLSDGGSEPEGGPEPPGKSTPSEAPPKGDLSMVVRGVTYQLDKVPLAQDKLKEWKVAAYKGAQGATFTPGGPDMGPLSESAVGMVINEPAAKVQEFYKGKTKDWKDFKVWAKEMIAAMQPKGEGGGASKAPTAEEIDKELPGWWRLSPDGFTLIGVIGDDAGKQTGVLVVHRDEGIAGAMMQMMSGSTPSKGTGTGGGPSKSGRSKWRQ